MLYNSRYPSTRSILWCLKHSSLVEAPPHTHAGNLPTLPSWLEPRARRGSRTYICPGPGATDLCAGTTIRHSCLTNTLGIFYSSAPRSVAGGMVFLSCFCMLLCHYCACILNIVSTISCKVFDRFSLNLQHEEECLRFWVKMSEFKVIL